MLTASWVLSPLHREILLVLAADEEVGSCRFVPAAAGTAGMTLYSLM